MSGDGESSTARLRRALDLLKRGKHAEAREVLARILEGDENHFDALQLTGVTRLEQGGVDDAVAFFRRALAVRDDQGAVHDNLGTALRMRGEVEAAIESHRRAIALQPAIAAFHNNLGIASRRAGRLEEASRSYQRALELDPGSTNARFNLGNVQREIGKLEDSIHSYEQVLKIQPEHVDARYNLGCVRAQRRELPEAVDCFEEVMRLDPDHALAPGRLGAFLVELGRFEQAGKWLDVAVARNPTDADAHCNRGALLQAMGCYEQAIESCQRALQIDPSHPDAAWNLSLPLLVLGRFREGWHFHEQRPGVRSRGPVLMLGENPVKRWRGEPLAGRRLLLLPEQGLGDQIQCLRFVPELQRRGAIVDLVVAPELRTLAASISGAAWVGTRPREGSPLPESWNFLMSVPAMLGTTLESIPGAPYLEAPPERVQRWAARPELEPGRHRVRVGLAWAGNPRHRNDQNRSIPVDLLGVLGGVEGVTLVSLQKGADAGAIEAAFGPGRVLDLAAELTDMAETAALMQSLDLIITVDTAVAHLAGALGRPVWTLVPHVPDWRWLLERNDTPWYPSMRLFRQVRPGDWSPVLEEVRTRLGALARKSPFTGKVREGTKRLQAGQFDECLRILEEVLEIEPDNVDALHYSGVAMLCRGRSSAGVERIERALRQDPGDSAAQQNLANGYRALGRIDDALASYGRAIELKADYPDALENRAHLLRDLGRHAEAERDYRRVIEITPDRAASWDGLGCALAARGKPEEAIAAFQQALDRKPGDESALTGLGQALKAQGKAEEALKAYLEAHRRQPTSPAILNHLGNAFRALKRYDKALESYRLALSLKPDSAAVLCNLSALHAVQKRYEEGIDAARQALALKPDRVEALNNLANNLQGLDRYDEAEQIYLEGLEVDPRMSELWNNLGLVRFQTGRIEEAISDLDHALGIDPEYHDASWNKALALLLLGRHAEGWELYEHRSSPRRRDRVPMPEHLGIPRWKGEDLEGKRLLVVREQGLGDQIQFIRYAPLLARLGITVDVALAPELGELIETVPGIRAVLPEVPRSADGYDRWVPVMSLPYCLRERHPEIPGDVPYITASREKVEEWARRLATLAGRGPKVGLAWAGNPAHPHDRFRSMDPALLEPLLALEEVTFVSLQKGPRSRTAAIVGGKRIHSLDDQLTSFAETAAVLENLDLVITVDTSVAHLAGAMGRPVWTMVTRVCDWRWGQEGDGSPWYPTLRLYRQPERGSWIPVVEKVRDDLLNRRRLRTGLPHP